MALVTLDPLTGAPRLLGQALHTQVTMHAAYGGVVPELASRDHIRRVVPLLRQSLDDAGMSLEAVDAIAYTAGPGLAGALLVGSAFAEALAFALDKPVLPVHHLEGHLLSPLLADVPPAFPFVALLVSGGHTQLMRVTQVGEYELLGETLDDAAGEAFDKTAKLWGWVIRAVQHCPNWQKALILRWWPRSNCRARCCILATWNSVLPGLKRQY